MTSFDEMVEAGAMAAYEAALDPGIAFPSWKTATKNIKQPFIDDATAILRAVLPLALGGARGALDRAELMLNTAANDAAASYDGGRTEQFKKAAASVRSALTRINALIGEG